MAVKNRPGSAKGTLAQQEADLRRGAPGGKRFIGEKAAQSERARRAQREAVERMAEIDSAEHEAAELPVSAILAELVQNSLQLARTLVSAPFRIAHALRRPREA